MDRVLFLNSSGAIITDYFPYPSPWGPRVITEDPLPVAPYVETVALPTVSIASSAIYGDRPENVATLTNSNGAALTFFCDSVAGGGDSRGSGTFDDPWRSLRTASSFLERNECVLRRAAAYVQLKVRGVVDYVSGHWKPFGNWDRFILAGWGGRCDLGGSGTFFARYLLDLRGKGYFDGVVTYSGCAIPDGGGERQVAVDCELDSGAELLCAWNCSGAKTSGYLGAQVIRGGSFRHGVSARYICSAAISAAWSGAYVSRTGLFARVAAVGVSVTAAGAAAGNVADVTGIYVHNSAYLAGCVVDVRASAHAPDSFASAAARTVSVGYGTCVVVSGGSFAAVARASATASGRVDALAHAGGFDSAAQLTGVRVSLSASAGARLVGGSGTATETETIAGGGSSCWESRTRVYSGAVVTSSWSDSQCRGY